MLLSVSSTVGIALDVLIVALIVVFAFIGLRQGFFKSVLSMVSTLVVLIVSIWLASPVAKLINKIYDFTGLIAGKLCTSIAGMGAFYSEPIPAGVSGADLANSIPSNTNGFLKTLMSKVLNPLSAGEVEGATVAEIVSGSFASVIMAIIAGILLFILIKIVLSLATKLFDNITKNRVFGFFNKILGFVLGGLKGLLIIVLFAFILTLLTVVPFINSNVSPIIQKHTYIVKPIYNYTDKFVEKHIINGKLVQKWVDNLWENKYKGQDDNTPDTTPNGSLERPYTISLTENAGEWTATIHLEFSDTNTIQYYKLNASAITEATFGLTISVDDTEYAVHSADDTETALETYTSLDKAKQYIIKFTRGNTISTEANIIVTPNLS